MNFCVAALASVLRWRLPEWRYEQAQTVCDRGARRSATVTIGCVASTPTASAMEKTCAQKYTIATRLRAYGAACYGMGSSLRYFRVVSARWRLKSVDGLRTDRGTDRPARNPATVSARPQMMDREPLRKFQQFAGVSNQQDDEAIALIKVRRIHPRNLGRLWSWNWIRSEAGLRTACYANRETAYCFLSSPEGSART